MQPTILSLSTLEEFYSKVILPQFGIKQKQILWQEHRIIGPDNDAHVFLCDNRQMVLIFDDYPTTTVESLQKEFNDSKITPLPRGTGNVAIDDNFPTDDENFILRFGPGALPFTYIHNVTGYFKLFHIESNAEDVLHMQLIAKRRSLKGESSAYTSLLDIGFEIIALGKKDAPWDGLAHIARSANDIAERYTFHDLANFFYDIVEYADIYEDRTFYEYLDSYKTWLQELASESRINPGIIGHDTSLLEEFTFPIHIKMMKRPNKSPEYFIALAKKLNHLIYNKGLSVLAAAVELSYALDRPQIIADKRLRPALLAAYELELPHTIRKHDPQKQWEAFYKEIEAISTE